jgi:protein ImuA
LTASDIGVESDIASLTEAQQGSGQHRVWLCRPSLPASGVAICWIFIQYFWHWQNTHSRFVQLFPLPRLFEPVPGVGPGAGPPGRGLAATGTEGDPAARLALHPALWQAHQLARPGGKVQPSCFAPLDAVLPGGGWPTQALTELLLPHPGLGELRLLAPALAAVQAAGASLMWFDPPAMPCAWALGALGIDTGQLIVVYPRQALRGPARQRLPAADVLWALEQALKSGHVGAVLAWLPARLPADTLRRLQLAAQAHDGPAFLLRDVDARQQPSAAPLRLLLGAAGPDRLRVVVLKRRGPPLAQPLHLALPPVLSGAGLARALAGRVGPGAGKPAALTAAPPSAALQTL